MSGLPSPSSRSRWRLPAVLAAVLLVTGGPFVVAQDARTFFLQDKKEPTFRLFADPKPPPVLRPVQPRDRIQPRRVAPSTVVVGDAPAKPAVEATTFVAVIGDSLSELLAYGLRESFTDVPEVAFNGRARASSGLVRNDYYDWPKSIGELLASGEKVNFAVVMLGSNDRQALRDGEVSHEPFSERWRELYIQRIDAVVQAFTERKIPLIWVGMPPMKNERLSGDMILLNDLYRARVQRAGAVYVDLWEAFVDAENRFVTSGPDLSGQVTRLRTADGVHFTRAGAQKAAHFVEMELKRLLDTRGPSAVVAIQSDPGASQAEASPQRPPVDIALPPIPEIPGIPAIAAPIKPIAGPIMPLTRIEASPGAILLSRATAIRSDGRPLVPDALTDGSVPQPVPGRADDFRWPR